MFDHDDVDSTAHALEFVPPSQYNAFGPSTHSSNPLMVTETELEVQMKHSIHRIFQELLTKLGKIGGTAVHTGAFSKADWCHLVSSLVEIDSLLIPIASAIQKKDSSQAIL